MSYHQGFLYFSNGYGNAVEVINHARTAALLQQAINSGVTSRFANVAVRGGCDALNYNPCTMSSTGSVTSWQVLTSPNLIANAPWYQFTSGASQEAYGFFIEEWTGLDGAHHSRDVTPYGQGRGGGVLGPQSSGSRTMAFNVILCGSSERGLNYLFRWLESTLLACCDPNDSPTLWFREYCTGSPDLTDGLAHADGVGLVSGPTWESPPVDDGGCFIRRVSFTLATSSPTFFREPVTITGPSTSQASAITGATTAQQAAPLSAWVGTNVRVTGTMPTPEYGLVSPIVTFTSNMTTNSTTNVRKTLPRMRVYGLLNPTNAAVTDLTRMFPIGAVVLDNIPSGATVTVDVGAAKVWYQDNYSSYERISGMSLVQPVGPTFRSGSAAVPDLVGARLKRWFGFNNCQIGLVAVEPDVVPTSTELTDTITADWQVTIQSCMRFGSC